MDFWIHNRSFLGLLEQYPPLLQQDLAVFLHEADLPAPLDDACRYAVLSGGKRLRPLLVMGAFWACIQNADTAAWAMARRAAMCVELLHGYSLVHDDLPCMDNDVLRRGQPTCHVAFGENVALLAGDALQALAFEVLGAPISDLHAVDTALVGVLMQVFAPRARRMVSGQMRDVLGENQSLDQSALEQIHQDKTGALIEASVLMGALCARVDAADCAYLLAYAKALGLAFQVQDDVLDVVGDVATLGKAVGSDDKLQKSTYVRLLGVEGARQYSAYLFKNAQNSAAQLIPKYPNAVILQEIIAWVQKRTY